MKTDFYVGCLRHNVLELWERAVSLRDIYSNELYAMVHVLRVSGLRLAKTAFRI